MQDQIKFEYSVTELRPLADNRTTFVHHFTEAWDAMQIKVGTTKYTNSFICPFIPSFLNVLQRPRI